MLNFLDAPIFFTHLQPRVITALVKEETWNNPFLGALFSLWGGIPIKRGEIDLKAYSRSRDRFKEGNILAIAPEGTRSTQWTASNRASRHRDDSSQNKYAHPAGRFLWRRIDLG